MIQDNTENAIKEATKKQSYAAPTLVCYGKVGALTQSGTGLLEEAGSTGQDKMRPVTSDPRAKENIVRIGTHPFGIGLYLFDYKPAFQAQWGTGRQFGVMADEVETVMPEAVVMHPDGYKMVNYGLLGIERTVH